MMCYVTIFMYGIFQMYVLILVFEKCFGRKYGKINFNNEHKV